MTNQKVIKVYKTIRISTRSTLTSRITPTFRGFFLTELNCLGYLEYIQVWFLAEYLPLKGNATKEKTPNKRLHRKNDIASELTIICSDK